MFFRFHLSTSPVQVVRLLLLLCCLLGSNHCNNSMFRSNQIFLYVLALRNCGTIDPTEADTTFLQHSEQSLFGKTVNEMSRQEISSVITDILQRRRTTTTKHGLMQEQQQQQKPNELQTKEKRKDSDYELVAIPIVYHILSNQRSNRYGKNRFRPMITMKQIEWTTNITNKHYNIIYDKVSKVNITFASFVTDTVIVHNDSIKDDCGQIELDKLRSIVSQAIEWEYKMHVVVCHSELYDGSASLPQSFRVDDPLHNMVRIDYRAFACYDDDNNFLCNNLMINATIDKNGKQQQEASTTGWWVSRSNTVAHEFGHLFGLFHTFQGGCYSPLGDGIPDTPSESLSDDDSTCPGLLPYNKDRDLFDTSIRTVPNQFTTSDECGGTEYVCGTTCAACCVRSGLFRPSCDRLKGITGQFTGELLTEDDVPNPICCDRRDSRGRQRRITRRIGYNNTNKPIDSCPLDLGIDPKNNIMGYSPDYCMNEFTAGQFMRMIAQIRSFKDYIYCNYANILDYEKCFEVPCATTATMPNCVQ